MGLSNYHKTFKESNEPEFKQIILSSLSNYFEIKEEVQGRHMTGALVRIDAVIKPKNIGDWKNKDIAFGVEFKSPAKLKSLGGQLHFMKQCVDYSYSNFESFGFIPIVACHRFSIDETYSNEISLRAFRHFMNQFHVGELDNTYRDLSIIFADSHYIWQDGKVHEGKRWRFKKSIGSK